MRRGCFNENSKFDYYSYYRYNRVMNIAVSEFRSRASEILSHAQDEDVLVTNHGNAYAVVISQERYNQLISGSKSGLEAFQDLTKVDIEEDDFVHPEVPPRPVDL